MSKEPIFWADGSDPQMARASADARQTFRYFWREMSWEYRRIVPAYGLAIVKAMFSQGSKVEHMWLGEIDFDGRVVSGVLLNAPNDLTDIAKGDRVQVPFGERLSDWMIADGKRVYGGFTVHLLRSRMTPKERTAHDRAWGLPFGDPTAVELPYAKTSSDEADHPMAVNMAASLEKHLAAQPATIHQKDERGWTMLHREALAGNAGIVAVLLRHGADARAAAADGSTPGDLARWMGWTRVVELLGAAGGR